MPIESIKKPPDDPWSLAGASASKAPAEESKCCTGFPLGRLQVQYHKLFPPEQQGERETGNGKRGPGVGGRGDGERRTADGGRRTAPLAPAATPA